jgi:TonB-linked SusC/RagA family outer membrane protein
MTTMNTMTRARTIAVGLLSLSFTLPVAKAEAQAVVTGRVASEAGQLIEAANLYINDLAISIITNAQGVYTFTVPAARVNGQQANLRIRALGYSPQVRVLTLTTGNQTQNFTMRADVNRLSEIVVTGVVGQGEERAKVPHAVARLTTEDIPVVALDPIRALSGKVSALRIQQNTGQPGTNPEIMLRGPTSINGTGRDRSPLIIVDGVKMAVGSLNELGGMDIESVEVVKGAAGASIYGTSAANGVITITTKRGAQNGDGIKFNARTEYGASDLNSINYGMPVNHPLQLDETGKRFCVGGASNIAPCSRSVSFMHEILRINAVNADTTRTPQALQWANPTSSELQNVFQSQIWPDQYYNSLAQAVRKNPVTLNAVDASGKLGNVRFFASGSYQDEQGAILGLKGNQQRRGRVNLDYDVRPDLTIQISSLYDNGTNDNRTANGVFGSLLRGTTPGTDLLARDSLGRNIIVSGGTGFRPTGNGGGTFLYALENAINTREIERFTGSVSGRYFPKEWVTFESNFAYDNRQRLDNSWVAKGFRTAGISTGTNNGNITLETVGDAAMNGSAAATFRKQLKDDLSGRVQFRGIFDQEDVVTVNSSGQVFQVKDVYTTTNTTTNKTVTSQSSTVKNVGVSAGTGFDFKDRYSFNATARIDGSSLFGAGERFANYGSFSGVWQIGREPFWKIGWMSDFRLRASRGTAGTPPRFNAQYETYTVAATGLSLVQLGNPKLKPEVTTETEVGTDFTLFNRLGVEVTNVLGITKDQILLVNTPAALGFQQQWQNAGTLENRTWEVALNLPVVTRKNLTWNMRGTYDRTRTFITELFTPDFITDAGTGQGTGTFFRNTANPGLSNGFQMNRFGSIWGRKFYKTCGDMPSTLQPQCGDGKAFQVNDRGYVVWVGAGNSWRDGITKNLWQTYLPAGQSPFGSKVPLYFGLPIIDRPLAGQPGEGNGITQIIGNVLPDFNFSYGNNIQYKRLTLYALLQGTIGHDIYNQGEGWGLLDHSSSNFDQAKQTVETAKPVGYSWRAGPSESTGIGGFYDVLGPNNYTVEKGSFAKVRELSVSYKLGRVKGVGDWTVGVVGRNLFTFTNYSGLDPEVGQTAGSTTNGTGSGILNQVDAFGFPTLRTFTVSIASRF